MATREYIVCNSVHKIFSGETGPFWLMAHLAHLARLGPAGIPGVKSLKGPKGETVGND